jgi:DNA (cytosine-5)-methyltransferase 1
MLVLSLFPGIGLLDYAFESEGFCVVRGPDSLWGGDIRTFKPPSGRFDGIIAGPPCQAFSRMRHLVIANGYQPSPNLIPEFERVIREAKPRWFLMENVPDAPEPDGFEHSALIRDHDCGGLTSRTRRFSWAGLGVLDLPKVTSDPAQHKAVTCDARSVPVALGGSGKPKSTTGSGRKAKSIGEMLTLQGFPSDLLDDCPLTVSGKRKVVGNGVPLAIGKAVAQAVKRALDGR